MIDFYALTSPNVQKIFIALEELQLPYQPIYVDIWAGEHFTDEFAKLNLNRKIPVIVDHDGPGGKPYTVFESGAILMYLADKTGKLLPADKAARFDAFDAKAEVLALLHAAGAPTDNLQGMGEAGDHYHPGQALGRLRGAAVAKPLCRRHRIFHRRYRSLSMAAQLRLSRHEFRRPAQTKGLCRQNHRASGGAEDAGDPADHQIFTRYRNAGAEGPRVRPRKIRKGVSGPAAPGARWSPAPRGHIAALAAICVNR